MRCLMVKKIGYLVILLLICATISVSAGEKFDYKGLAQLGWELQDFTLPVLGGGEFKLSDYKGKNVLLVFPRGYYSKDVWCDICAYQYSEFVHYEKTLHLREKYNMEIAFILPYNKTTVEKWFFELPEVLQSLLKWKKIDRSKASEGELLWSKYCVEHYPLDFDWKNGEAPNIFKILIDDGAVLTKRMDIFRTKWERTEMEQNQPTVILLDKNHVVVFKHQSQYTLDRPDVKYLIKIFDTFLK